MHPPLHTIKSHRSINVPMASLLITLLLPWVDAHPASADKKRKHPPADATVFVVLAREEPGEVDPELKGMSALRRPPFNGFRSMSVLRKENIKLHHKRDSDLKLPNGRQLRLNASRLPDGRHRVKVSINKPKKKDYLPLLQVVAAPGDPFFVAGQSYKNGTLIVGIQVGKK